MVCNGFLLTTLAPERVPALQWAGHSGGRLAFHANPETSPQGDGFGGWALISKQTFPRTGRIAVEADLTVLVVKRDTPLRELVGVEAIDHEGASFVADPSVGLYFTGERGVPAGGSFVEGFVGPVRVWTADESTASRPAVASLQHLQR